MRIVITGGTGALGAAVITALDCGQNRLVSLVRSVGSNKSDTVVDVPVNDLTDPNATREAFQKAKDVLGQVDAVVHLAGGFDWMHIADSTLDDWWKLYATNVGTTINIVHAALPHFAESGSIICVGAASAQPANEGMAPYAAAKSGVARIVEALAQELRPRKIRVNAVAPSIIDTPRNRSDMPDVDPANWTTAAAIADVIRFLITKEARAINGTIIPVTNNA